MTTKVHVNRTENRDLYFTTVEDAAAQTLSVITPKLVSRDEAIESGYAYCVDNFGTVPGHSIQQHACTRLLCDADLHNMSDGVYAWRCITTIEDVLNENIPTMPDTEQPEPMGYEDWEVDGRW